jgi:hypothetical protein
MTRRRYKLNAEAAEIEDHRAQDVHLRFTCIAAARRGGGDPIP